MTLTDPVDIRLVAALAEVGKVAVHELATRLGMDPRDVASRLVNLSAAGLPLLVGVESDPQALRQALASPPQRGPSPPSRPPAYGAPSGPYPAQGVPSGPYPAQGVPSGPYPAQGAPSGPYPFAPVPQQAPPATSRHAHAPGPTSQQNSAVTTWGPPQSALWARGDQHSPSAESPPTRQGHIGDVFQTEGPEGEQLGVQLLEVQDPADYLFAAAGYSLDEGERAIVAHTEVSNRGQTPFASLPDNYLELVTAEGETVTKAPISLTSRPPHQIGVDPGDTSGGHTVYVLAETTSVASVRWSPRPEPDERTVIWEMPS